DLWLSPYQLSLVVGALNLALQRQQVEGGLAPLPRLPPHLLQTQIFSMRMPPGWASARLDSPKIAKPGMRTAAKRKGRRAKERRMACTPAECRASIGQARRNANACTVRWSHEAAISLSRDVRSLWRIRQPK